jgi:hypothetical protein
VARLNALLHYSENISYGSRFSDSI